MEEQRRGGFRVKPSFGQVLGYIQEGEPLALDLPEREGQHLYFFTLVPGRLPQRPGAPQRCADAAHDAEPGGCVRDR